MRILRAIIIGIEVWGLLLATFALSPYLSILSNPELQEYLLLGLGVLLFGVLGSAQYYHKERSLNGWHLGITMALMAVIMDALVTVPFYILPVGGSYQEFFSNPAFWIIIAEYVLVVYFFWKMKVQSKTSHTQQSH